MFLSMDNIFISKNFWNRFTHSQNNRLEIRKFQPIWWHLQKLDEMESFIGRLRYFVYSVAFIFERYSHEKGRTPKIKLIICK